MNKQLSKQEQERFQQLLMLVVDQEATPDQQHELQRMIEKYPYLQNETNEYKKIKEVIHTMKFKTPPDDVWDRHWLGIYNRIERGLAWILFSIGAVILISYGIFHFIEAIFTDTQITGIIKFGILAIVVGLVILLVSVFREKMIVRKKDPYKEVQR
jgi:hypothetical protein